MGAAYRNSNAYDNGAISVAAIADVRSRTFSGGTILRADVNTILNGLQNAVGHTHTYYDQVTLHDYGNVDGGSYAITGTTQGSTTAYGGAIVLSTAILASEVNIMANKATEASSHSHQYADN